SVKVNKLFKVEKYETLYQMISVIKAKIKEQKLSDILLNIFPCGSITGAPKIRTMEIIKEIEKENRGIYTGAIGFVYNKNYNVNVAIRTLVIKKENKRGELGIGSGIVWDGIADKEYDEVKLKSYFLTKPFIYFELFETILIENKKVFLLDKHLKRLKLTAKYFLFCFNEKKVLNGINSLIELLDNNNYKVKITLNKWGNIKFDYELLETKIENIKIIISNKQISSDNKFQYFKTTLRSLYNNELIKYKKRGFSEVLFLNENNLIAEGSFTNIFINKEGKLTTPQISNGLLNGIYRQKLLEKIKDIKECDVAISDLIAADSIFVCNSVRKEINVSEIWYNNNCIWQKKITA
nr:aminotransferase class IV [Melioribacteraceae bacterium]